MKCSNQPIVYNEQSTNSQSLHLIRKKKVHTVVCAVHKIQFWKPNWRYENWMELIFEFYAGSLRRKAFKAIRKGNQWVLLDVAYR